MTINVANLIGTNLKADDFEKGRVFTTVGAPNAKYAWDTGIAMGRYLAELKQGKLIARRCDKCARVMIPPRMFCEMCFRPTDEWVYVKDTGVVNTFSICYVTWDMVRIKKPQIPAVIEIDGASKGMGIMHLIAGVDPKKVKIGMKVRAVWKSEKERVGAITDIKYWTAI